MTMTTMKRFPAEYAGDSRYSSEQIAAMSDEEVMRAIRDDHREGLDDWHKDLLYDLCWRYDIGWDFSDDGYDSCLDAASRIAKLYDTDLYDRGILWWVEDPAVESWPSGSDRAVGGFSDELCSMSDAEVLRVLRKCKDWGHMDPYLYLLLARLDLDPRRYDSAEEMADRIGKVMGLEDGWYIDDDDGDGDGDGDDD